MAEPAMSLDDARAIVAASPFTGWWGLEVDDVDVGVAAVSLPFRPELTRPGGVLHGSAYEVVADVALWVAIMSKVGPEPMAVTIEMKTSFLRGARSAIRSRAEVLRLGRRVVFGVATTTDAGGAVVAHSTLTYARA